MIAKLLLAAAGLIAVCSTVDRWSRNTRSDRRRVRRVDLPRWEGEGGSPPPEPATETGDATTSQATA